MIKDKITPELKKAFSESIKKTEESGNEHGFFMCINKDGKLSASRIKCEGDTCGITMRLSPEVCADKNQGFFHVHPGKLRIERQIGRKVTEEDKKSIVITDRRGKITTVHTPSHSDVLTILLTKCDRLTEGTICTAGDIEPDKVECWTPKKGAANLITCSYAKRDNILTKEKDIRPKTWIKHLFNKEIIDLER
jgi:hypothetical protein